MSQHERAKIHATKEGGSKMKITTLGIDMAKRSFHVLGADARGQVVLRKKLTPYIPHIAVWSKKRIAYSCNLTIVETEHAAKALAPFDGAGV